MNNPYVSRGPVRVPDMFFGRVHELDQIAAFLRGNQSISIVGPRKIGKTSLLFHLRRSELWPALGLDQENLLIYLDCEVLGDGTHEEIFGQFAEEIAAALDERGLPPEAALEKAVANPTRLSFEAAVRKLNQPKEYAPGGLRVVLMLDEFERLSTNPHLDVNFFNALRSAAGRYRLVFITASARPLIELTFSDRSQEILSSPFFNIFAPLFLGLFSEADARQLIRQPALAAGLAFSRLVEDLIYDLVGGHPLALQVACFHAFNSQAEGHPDPGAEIERETTLELSAHFQYYWRNLAPIEQSILRQVSEVAWRAAEDTTVRGVLRDLVHKCLLVADGANYHYPSRAWADFVLAQRAEVTDGESRPNARPEAAPGGTFAGAQLGQYEVLALLGRGGMAEVYRGRHTRLDRIVAIKVLPPSLAAEADFRQRFEREARAVAALKHPNIVQIFDFGDAEGTYYMVMEYIAGQDLAHVMRQTGPMPLEQVCSLVRGIASALDYAHAQGLVHRDVKPSNVMLEAEGQGGEQPGARRAVLTDFGIAKILAGSTGATKTGMVGTLDYIAPEQIRAAGTVDARADIYALGVMLYQMLTGRLPFVCDNPGAVLVAHLQQPPPDPRLALPSLPEGVARAILCALAKDPDERFRTAGALLEALAS